MNRFKIVSVGWTCADWLEQTLRSVEEQTVDNWNIWITYDPSDDNGADRIRDWCATRDKRWNYTINDTRQWAVRNQAETLHRLAPADDDIIVFLDLDGDRFAHPDVLARLADAYADGTLLTYGSYEPVPFVTTCLPATAFPDDIIQRGAYREHMITTSCCFNHLRTMSGRVFNNIPADQFQWQDGPKAGEWYAAGTDYIFMVAGLELSGGRHKLIPETLLLYNHANPHADYLDHPAEADACIQNYLRRPQLAPL